MLDLEQVMARKARTLSGRFQQNLDIELALVIQPDLMILDEPLAEFDAPTRDRMTVLV